MRDSDIDALSANGAQEAHPRVTDTAPRTDAGRRMLRGIQETSERLDVALNALDYILAIEAEAAALTPAALDVERLAHAMGVFAFPPVSWPPDPSFLEEISAEYARLSAGQAGEEG